MKNLAVKRYENPYLKIFPAANGIWTINKDKHDNLLIGAQEGAFVFDLKKKKFMLPEFLTDSIKKLFINEPITSFLQDSYDDYWFSTAHKGVVQYFSKEKRFAHYHDHGDSHGLDFKGFYVMKEDSKGNMWFLYPGIDRLYLYDRKTETFINFKKSDKYKGDLGNAIIDDMNTDKNGNIWFGSNEGIFIYSIITNNTMHFNQADGLCSNIINNITILDSGIA